MNERRRVFGLAAGTFGIAALFLPFTSGISPLDALQLSFDLEGDGFFLFSIAAPTLLALPIAVWQVRRVLARAPCRLEIALAYGLSTLAMLPVVTTSALMLFGAGPGLQATSVAALVVEWCAVVANLVLLAKNRRSRRLSPGSVAEVYLLLGYVPNALYGLVFFSYWSLVFSPRWAWDTGAWWVLASSLACVAQTVLLMRRQQR
jgi:hypothetical protein